MRRTQRAGFDPNRAGLAALITVLVSGSALGQGAPAPNRPVDARQPQVQGQAGVVVRSPPVQIEKDSAANERSLREAEARDKRREARMRRVMKSVCGRC